MRNIKLLIAYDGTRFAGWQKQKNSPNTLQALFEHALQELLEEDIDVIASGRTDAGVHAMGQAVNFHTKSNKGLDEMAALLNEKLPKAITVKGCEEVPERFHARYHAKSKKYIYQILNSTARDPFVRRYSYHYSGRLDVGKMAEAAKIMEGSHDFLGFSSLKKSKKPTVRTLYSITIQRNGDMVVLEYYGDGFLYNMVRIITGTLIEIGAGQMDTAKIHKVFFTRERQWAGFTAPPQGLFLKEVQY